MIMWWLVALLVALPGYSQERTIPLRVNHCACRIEERVAAVLGRATDSVLTTPFSRVVRLGSTRYLVGPTASPGQLAVYDASGLLERVIGRQGAGPGEFSRYLGPLIPTSAGGAVVVDLGTGRLTLVDSLGSLRAFGRVGGSVFGGVALRGGHLLLNAKYGGEHSAFPLHVVADGGNVVRSFGDASKSANPRSPPPVRIIAPGANGRVWYTPHDAYRLTLADSLGRTILVLTRKVDASPASAAGTLTFYIASIREDSAGLVWVVTGQRTGQPAVAKREAIADRSLASVAAGLTSTIDVVDPRQGRVIASEARSGPPHLFFDDGYRARYREDSEGNPRIEIVSIRLRPR
jgi:hypothetical protein